MIAEPSRPALFFLMPRSIFPDLRDSKTAAAQWFPKVPEEPQRDDLSWSLRRQAADAQALNPHCSVTGNGLSGRRRDASSAPDSSRRIETVKAKVQLWVRSIV